MNKLILILLVALVVALLAAGCGGGGGDNTASDGTAADTSTATTTSTATLTKAELIKQGDAICTKIDTEQKAALSAALKKDPKAQTGKANQEKLLTEIGIPPIKAGVEALASLIPPGGDEAKIEAIVTGIEEGVKKSEEDPSILLSTSTDPFAKPGKLAGEYGFKVCSTPS
jgi:hypothetical protein